MVEADNVNAGDTLNTTLTDVYVKGDIYGFYSYPDIDSPGTEITFVDL